MLLPLNHSSPADHHSYYHLLRGLTTTEPLRTCRDRHGEFPPALYNLVTCAMCYVYVYPGSNVSFDDRTLELVLSSDSNIPVTKRVLPDPQHPESVRAVCGSLEETSQCWKWLECCRHASDCCVTQLEQGPRLYQEYGSTLCPRTWDGYACWSDTLAGHRPTVTCPAFVPLADVKRQAYKTCTKEGVWYLNSASMTEWTDYTECANMETYHRLHKAGVVCNLVTIVLLLPALVIFLIYRQLRQQHRIRLHVCLLTCSWMTSVHMLVWELTVIRDTLDLANDGADLTSLATNSTGCRLLFLMIRYWELACFMWMFVEGFHLHRLLVHAFSTPKTLKPYYIFGFGFPVVPIAAYSIIRGTQSQFNQKCWIYDTGGYEWFMLAPSLAALVINLVFMVRIILIMVRQLEPHPNEPCNFRRAVRAVFFLVPLFGAQFLLFVYRPQDDSFFWHMSDLFNKICASLQGAVIAVSFCYLNKEVRSLLGASFMRLLLHTRKKEFFTRSVTAVTQYSTDLHRARVSQGEAGSYLVVSQTSASLGQELNHHHPDWKQELDGHRPLMVAGPETEPATAGVKEDRELWNALA